MRIRKQKKRKQEKNSTTEKFMTMNRPRVTQQSPIKIKYHFIDVE